MSNSAQAKLQYAQPQYYSHSGAVPPAGFLGGIIVGAVVAILGGIAYGYGDHYITFIYIRAIMTLAFGALLGAVPAAVMIKARVRNNSAVVFVAAVAALVGYYVAWVSWICALFNDLNHPIPPGRLIANPIALVRIIARIDALGAWTVDNGNPVSGIALGAVWFIEFALIFGAAVAAARSLARKRPFCEACGQWADPSPSIADTAYFDPADLKQRLESRQFDFVPQLPRDTGAPGPHLSWDIHQCPACRQFNTLTVKRVTVSRDRRGRTQKRKKVLIDKLLVTTPELEKMRTKLVVPPPQPGQWGLPTAQPAQATFPSPPTTAQPSLTPVVPPPPVAPNFPRPTNEDLLDL